MSLNCLSCQVLQRTDSDLERDNGVEKYSYEKLLCSNIGRSSGNLVAPSPCKELIKSESMFVAPKKATGTLGHRRLQSSGAFMFEGTTEPRVVKSYGMRRDWSIKNLRQRDKEKGRIIYG
ncbi:LOW QUALITY PROTEIN: hypothetical protein TorRG33x02_167530 [Trema orientale]|uniref:Uncharacterized protein n=1 Tax=Trema orientale TaxID=63057 RepID=A0A2P5EPC6_TREOI|nr:LOW QUALITY PROTEIN: hypothetical protein TorRG33x02_167530 [Trema orientale]